MRNRTSRSTHLYCMLSLLSTACFAGSLATAQTPSSPVILTPFEQKSILGVNPQGATFKSLKLSGTASWIAGSLKESGNISLKVVADGSTEEKWDLPTRSHSHIETSLASGRTCIHTDAADKQVTLTDPGCLRGVPWFAPWLGFALLPSGVVFADDMTKATDVANGVTRFSYRTNLGLPKADGAESAALSQLHRGSAVSVLYDSVTALPTALEYDDALNSDSANMISYRLIFSDYRAEAGLVLPHHIQRFVQRTLQADITFNSFSAE